MVSLRDVRPVLYIARLLGCGLYIVHEDDIVLMRYARAYSFVFALIYASFCVTNFCMLQWMDEVLGAKMLTLTIVRTAISYLCVLSDILITFVRNCKIRTAFSYLRIFDRATRYRERSTSRTVHFVCWSLPLVNLSFWSVVGYITFCVELKDSVFNGVTYAIVNACLSMQLMVFASLSFLLYKRFQHLCEQLLMPQDGKIMMVEDRSRRQLHLQEVWWLHSCLADATEMINSTYALQLFLWIACMSFNLLTRIYTIGSVELSLLIARECLLVSACVVNLLIITVFSHATAAEANRVGKVAFSPSSIMLAKRCLMQDLSAEAMTYFQIRQVNFFALAGIIRIDLPLLLSIIAGITTYVVILHSANM